MHVTAIVAAGGRGQRFGGIVPKQLLAVGGRSLLERSVALFIDHPDVDDVIVVLPVELAGSPPPYLLGRSKPVHVVAGGARRQDSVLNGFKAVSAESDVVVVHDAARPFATPDLVSRTIAAAAETGAAVAALSARDTVKFATPDGPGAGRDHMPAQAGYHVQAQGPAHAAPRQARGALRLSKGRGPSARSARAPRRRPIRTARTSRARFPTSAAASRRAAGPIRKRSSRSARSRRARRVTASGFAPRAVPCA